LTHRVVCGVTRRMDTLKRPLREAAEAMEELPPHEALLHRGASGARFMRAEDTDPIPRISKETPAGLDLWADRARLTPWIRSPAGWVRDRALDVRYLYRSCRVTRDRLEVGSYRKHAATRALCRASVSAVASCRSTGSSRSGCFC
jgi:hypothetical protein